MDHGLNVKYKTIKLFRKIGETIWKLQLAKEFLELTSKISNLI